MNYGTALLLMFAGATIGSVVLLVFAALVSAARTDEFQERFAEAEHYRALLEEIADLERELFERDGDER